jgi:hypothetical protein
MSLAHPTAELARWRDSWSCGEPGQRSRVVQVGLKGGDDHSRFDGQQVDADERKAHPTINDDAFVQHSVEHVYYACASGRSFKSHVSSSSEAGDVQGSSGSGIVVSDPSDSHSVPVAAPCRMDFRLRAVLRAGQCAFYTGLYDADTVFDLYALEILMQQS